MRDWELETLSPLERAIMEAYHRQLTSPAFPGVDGLSVELRELEGRSVFVYLADPRADPVEGLTRGYLEHPLDIEMEAVDGKLGTSLMMEHGQPRMLEIFPRERAVWDGEERPWQLLENWNY